MTGTLPALPVRYRRSPGRMVLLIVLSLGFVVVGALMARDNPTAGLLCIGLFGACAAVGAFSLHPRASHLELSDDGFAVTSLFRRRFVPWSHVGGFVVVKIQHNTLVGWNHRPGFAPVGLTGRGPRGIAGVEAALPDSYGMATGQLAALMNALLAARQAEHGEPTAEPSP